MTARAKSRSASSRTETTTTALGSAHRVIAIEVEALRAISDRLGSEFENAVDAVLACNGRIVVTGMGKSGLVCRKIAATFASTGTSAFFLHAAEASHGDLGMFARGDLCLAVSNSGRTHELLSLLPSVKRLSLPVIAITGDRSSPLAEASDIVLDVSVPQEACPLGLAPTASTTATMALGDALAVAVLEKRGFSERDFALLHPGGSLGTKLMRVREVMAAHTAVPTVDINLGIQATLEAITAGGLGVAAVVDASGSLCGAFTDGDLRRSLLREQAIDGLSVGDVMSRSPKTVAADALAAEALALMETHAITSLFIVDERQRPVGIVHLHDLLKAGVA